LLQFDQVTWAQESSEAYAGINNTLFSYYTAGIQYNIATDLGVLSDKGTKFSEAGFDNLSGGCI
jgi:hypothetical protein